MSEQTPEQVVPEAVEVSAPEETSEVPVEVPVESQPEEAVEVPVESAPVVETSTEAPLEVSSDVSTN